MRRLPLIALVFGLANACSCEAPDDLPHLTTPEGCQPLLNGYDCFLPYPSDYFRVDDPSLPSGARIETTGAARLKTKSGANADVNTSQRIDGFSRIPYIVFAFPNDVQKDGFVRLFDDPAASTSAATSNTLLIEASTGVKVPHFVDLDARATDPLRRALTIHPYVQLNERNRYVVLVHGVKQADGALVPAPEGFARLRDGTGRSDPALEKQRASFDDRILATADVAGVPREELQLAWEFTTGSDEHVQRDMLRVRELTLAWLAANTPVVKITKVVEAPDADIWRRVYGTISMPLFMESTDPGAKFTRDAEGNITQNGTDVFPFIAQIPNSVRDQFGPGRSLSYGHGFFGGSNESEAGAPRTIANRLHATMFAIDWWGMALGDSVKLADALTNRPFQTFDALDRTHQGMANWLVLTQAMERVFPDLPEFKRPTVAGMPGVSTNGMGMSNAGQPVIAGGAEAYVGISQGAILGGTMVALNPDITRPVLNVGGAAFTHMMFRAKPFTRYLFLLDISMPDPFEQQKLVATMQRPFDRFDPATWNRFLVTEKLPGTPERRVLYQYGIGDALVPNLGTHLAARIAGFKQLDDGSPGIFGVEKIAGPVEGSALVAYDFGIDVKALNEEPIPPEEENEVHEGVRRLEAALVQMDTFVTEGRIVNACSGRCDPE